MIEVLATETLVVRQEQDITLLNGHVRQQAALAGMNSLGKTKLITATSELARNMLLYAGGGQVLLERVRQDKQTGIRLVFTDTGPGIADLNLVLQDGYTTSAGMGLGLPGAKRLMDTFQLQSTVGEGTTVTIVKWTNE